MKEYDKTINENARQYGFKSANLIFLDEILKSYQASDAMMQVSVPAILPLSSDDIIAHLNKNSTIWHKQWDLLQKSIATDRDSSQTTLSDNSLSLIKSLQDTIKFVFESKEFSVDPEKLVQFKEYIMVRSTGKEDAVDMANPGANESLPSDLSQKNISAIIGEVVASYVGEKSLSQRLKSQDDLSGEPFFPVLIQQMVAEGVGDSKMVYSGVIYTGDNTSMIDAAPGHCELIVNSKGNFDNFYVTANKTVYSEIQAKDTRAALEIESGKKVFITYKKNEPDTILEFSLEPSDAQYIHDVAQFIEEKYGIPMDIEFVFDKATHSLSIVQARAITAHSEYSQSSAISPEYLADIEKDGGQKIKGNNVTTKVTQAVLINDSSEVIIVNTITEALNKYLADKDNKAKAVIIKYAPPSNSHEAGEFAAHSIPVIQISDLKNITELFKSSNKIIIDPQRKSIFQLPTNIKGTTIEELKQGDNPIIKNGIFASGIKSSVTAYQYNFAKPTDANYNPDSTISNLAKEITESQKSGEAASQLFSGLFKNIREDKSFGDKLSIIIQECENPLQDKATIISKLKHINFEVAKLAKNKYISEKLMQNIIITSSELINRLEKFDSKNASDLNGYLDVYQKFYGLIYENSSITSIVDSVNNEMQNHKLEQNIKDKVDISKISSVNIQKDFMQAAKASSLFLTEKYATKWIEFVYDLAQKNPASLNNMLQTIGNIAKIGILSEFLNVRMVEAFLDQEKTGAANSDVALNIDAEFLKISTEYKEIKSVEMITRELFAQTADFATPQKFAALFSKFEKGSKSVIDSLKLSQNDTSIMKFIKAKLLADFVDAMDISLKSLEKSTEYSNKESQVANFKQMLFVFKDVMTNYAKQMPFSNLESMKIIDKKISDILYSKITNYEKALSPSQGFDVSAVTYNRSSIEVARPLNGAGSLEDIFTMIHQNIMTSINIMASSNNLTLLEQQTPMHRDFVTEFNSKIIYGIPMKLNLTSCHINSGKLTTSYNIPLSNHSAILIVTDDLKDNTSTVEFKFFGHNMRNRIDIAQIYSLIILEQNKEDIETISSPVQIAQENNSVGRNVSRLSQYSLSSKVKVKHKEAMSKILDIVHQTCSTSFIPDGYALEYLTEHLSLDAWTNYCNLSTITNRKAFINKMRGDVEKLYQIISSDPTFYSEIAGELRIDGDGLRNSNAMIPCIIRDPKFDMMSTNSKGKSVLERILKKITNNLFNHYSEDGVNNNAFSSNLLKDLMNHPKCNFTAVTKAQKTIDEKFNLSRIRELIADPDKFKLLTSNEAMDAYVKGITFEQLVELDSDKLKAILSDSQKIDALTSTHALKFYNSGKGTIKDLQDCAPDVIKALTSDDAQFGYKRKYFTINDLKDCSPDVIELLSSDQALNGYMDKYFTVNDLKSFAPDVIKQILITTNFSTPVPKLVIDIMTSNDSPLSGQKAATVKIVLDDLSKLLGVDIAGSTCTIDKLYKFIDFEYTNRDMQLLNQDLIDHLILCKNVVDKSHENMIGDIEVFYNHNHH